jgi:hypothetical protein
LAAEGLHPEKVQELLRIRENEIYESEGLLEEIDESSMVINLGIFGDQKINKYMKYKEFLKRQDLTELFNLNN